MNIRDRLHELNITQSYLSKIIGCSEAQVSLMLSGKRTMSIETAAKIAKVLGCSIDDIFLSLNLTNS